MITSRTKQTQICRGNECLSPFMVGVARCPGYGDAGRGRRRWLRPAKHCWRIGLGGKILINLVEFIASGSLLCLVARSVKKRTTNEWSRFNLRAKKRRKVV